jgi:3-oxoacyl-[acyl-carrier protein] reductase
VDRSALITGGARGIGRAITLALAASGVKLGINYCQSEEAARQLAEEIKGKDGEAILLPGSISDLKAVEEMVNKFIERFGRIDILVNNAGIIKDNLFMSMERSEWDEVINTNLNGIFNMIQAVARHMMAERSGKIINISSLAASFGGKGQANYAATKAGINALTRVLALELGRKNITVNAIAPGLIETEMSGLVRNLDGEGILRRIPLNRFGRPEDVAELVLFLASDKANYITGQVITIDGGISLGYY